MEVPGPVSFGADESGDSPLRLATWFGVGFLVGAVSAVATYELYPPARADAWTIPALAVVSLIVVASLYSWVVRLGDVRSADWLVLGYAAALVLATGLVVARELLAIIREQLTAIAWSDGLEAMRLRGG